MEHIYRPQRSWAKVMFLQVSVILSTGGGSASVHAGIPPPWEQTPPRSRPPRDQAPPTTEPPGADTRPGPGTPRDQTPQSRHPPRADTPPPWEQKPSPRSRHPPRSRNPPPEQTPPREADASIRSMSGRYASYWNAFLFL